MCPAAALDAAAGTIFGVGRSVESLSNQFLFGDGVPFSFRSVSVRSVPFFLRLLGRGMTSVNAGTFFFLRSSILVRNSEHIFLNFLSLSNRCHCTLT